MKLRAWGLAALLSVAAPAAAHAQLFVATRPAPAFAIGPLFVQAAVTPALGPIVVDVLFSVDVPPTRSATDVEQDLFLLWPAEVSESTAPGPVDPALARDITDSFVVLSSGRLQLRSRDRTLVGT